MDRLIASNSVPMAQADTAPLTGTPQGATDGNPATNVPATRWPSYQYNAIQEELIAILTAAGITPDRTNNAQILAAIQNLLQGIKTNVSADTGSANAYVVAFSPALAAPMPWVPFWFKVAHTNTGASTLNASGAVEPLVGGAHVALQGGELVANGNALVYWNPTLASGAGSYVLLFCSGAPEQVAPGTQSQHAVQYSQVLGLGQTWQNLVGSRAVNTTYTNTTGKPIAVAATTTSSATQATTYITVNSIGVYGSSNYASGAPGSSAFAIVPPGATYSVSVTAGTPTLAQWSELR